MINQKQILLFMILQVKKDMNQLQQIKTVID